MIGGDTLLPSGAYRLAQCQEPKGDGGVLSGPQPKGAGIIHRAAFPMMAR